MKLRNAVIVDGVRSPFSWGGRGMFEATRMDELGGQVVRALMERNPKVKGTMIEDFGLGNVMGDRDLTLAKCISRMGGLPEEVPEAEMPALPAGRLLGPLDLQGTQGTADTARQEAQDAREHPLLSGPAPRPLRGGAQAPGGRMPPQRRVQGGLVARHHREAFRKRPGERPEARRGAQGPGDRWGHWGVD